jgi:4,5:9,10-diseco-3-hydroxy-5,9,17-trioxoandrosta-1(10),2-diene-4-oate hydrolase
VIGTKSAIVEILGSPVHYLEAGEGVPVLLLHGLGGSAEDWEYNLPAIARHYHIFALDFPGFGKSPPPLVKKIDVPFAMRVLKDFLDKIGASQVFVAGNSLGGGLALKFALTFPAMTLGVILANAGGLGHRVSFRLRLLSVPWLARRAISGLTYEQVKAGWDGVFANGMQPTRGMIDRSWAWISKPETKEFLPAFYPRVVSLLGQRRVFAGELHRITCPVLITWGREDDVLPVSQAYRANRLIRNSELHVFSPCAHMPQVEYAERFNAMTLDFMARASGHGQVPS